MKKEPLEYNIYFVIQPLHFVSKLLGLSPFHIYSNSQCHNGSVFNYSHIILVTVSIILLLYVLYNSIIFLDTFSEYILNISVRILWIIYMLVSNLIIILSLLLTVTRNRNHMRNVLCLLSLADSKMFRNKSRQSAYSQSRSHVIMQLWIMFISYVTVSSSCTSSYYNGMWK
jgi:hypothetical protein